MKLIVALCLVALVAAAPPAKDSSDNAQILSYENDVYDNGRYRYGFSQTDGQKREEQGELKNAGLENEYYEVKGSYEFVGPDGVTYMITYTADEEGFQPEINQGPGGAVPSTVVASILG